MHLYRQAVRAVMAQVNPTVEGFLQILSSLLIQQEEAEAKKGEGNEYSMFHWLGALEKVRGDLKGSLDSSDPKALEKLKASLSKRYILTYMPAVRKTIKAIDQYLATGKAPKYPVSPKVKQQLKEERAKGRADLAKAKAEKSEIDGIKGA